MSARRAQARLRQRAIRPFPNFARAADPHPRQPNP